MLREYKSMPVVLKCGVCQVRTLKADTVAIEKWLSKKDACMPSVTSVHVPFDADEAYMYLQQNTHVQHLKLGRSRASYDIFSTKRTKKSDPSNWKFFFALQQCKQLKTLSYIGRMDVVPFSSLCTMLATTKHSIQSVLLLDTEAPRLGFSNGLFSNMKKGKRKKSVDINFCACALYFDVPTFWPPYAQPASTTKKPKNQQRILAQQELCNMLEQGKFAAALALYVQDKYANYNAKNDDNDSDDDEDVFVAPRKKIAKK